MGELKSCPFCGGEASPNGVIRRSKSPDLRWLDGTECLEAFYCNCMSCGVNNGGAAGGYQTREKAIAKWNTRTVFALTPAQQAAEEMVEAARALADAMETCHQCNGTVFVQEQPVHCEDCSGNCDLHEGSECATIFSLHLALKCKLAALAKAGKP